MNADEPAGSSSRIQDLLRTCLVQVNPDQVTEGGSGFFAAPGLIITCAHVTRRAAGQRVFVRWGEENWPGTVDFTSRMPEPDDFRDRRLWPLPDVAVIRLDAAFQHPCARLAMRAPEYGEPLLAMGRFDALDEGPGDFTSDKLNYTGLFQEKMQLYGAGIGPGMSGGPVLDQRTGDVCGILKTADPDHRAYAVPVHRLRSSLPPELAGEMLLGHDSYHAGNPGWSQEQEPLWERMKSGQDQLGPVASVLQPREEARLLGLLARIPAAAVSPDTLMSLYRKAVDGRLQAGHDEPRLLRDLVALLGNHGYQAGQPHAVVLLADLVAAWLDAAGCPVPDSSATPGKLREWAVLAAGQHGSLPQFIEWRSTSSPTEASPTGLESFIIEFAPSYNSSADFRIEVSSYREGTNTVEIPGDDQYPRLKALERARDILAWKMREHGDSALMVEFVVPMALFDEPFELWEIFYRSGAWADVLPGQTPAEEQLRRGTRLGDRHPVVIRDFDRFRNRAARQHARSRWDTVLQGAGAPLPWLRCDEARKGPIIGRWIEANPEVAGLGMTQPGSEEPWHSRLDSAIYAGIPVAIWRRHQCGNCVPGQSGCDGGIFANVIDSVISGTRLLDVPEVIRRIRADPSTHPVVQDSLVLLWDDPRRGPWDN